MPIHAAIAAADAITCHALAERSNDGNHASAVDLLRQVDATLATTLKRSLDRKTQAAYESSDISKTDAASCVRWAKQLLTGPRRIHCSGGGGQDLAVIMHGWPLGSAPAGQPCMITSVRGWRAWFRLITEVWGGRAWPCLRLITAGGGGGVGPIVHDHDKVLA
jgi:hypothetical protein